MSDDVIMQLSSNSNPSDPSLPTKLAKLEARMAGRSHPSTSPVQPRHHSARQFCSEELPTSSDSDDDDRGGEFLIQANNTMKRLKTEVNNDGAIDQHLQKGTNGKVNMSEVSGTRSSIDDTTIRKKQGCGRVHSVGRGRGSKVKDPKRSSLPSSKSFLNGHLEESSHKEMWSREHLISEERASLQEEEIISLRGKTAILEEQLSKSRHEVADHQKVRSELEKAVLDHQKVRSELEKELKDIKEQEQQMKVKIFQRARVLSNLLMSVSKSERQEARLKVQQESLRLGNVGVIRVGTVISETWEDGQALKDINSVLKGLLESKESIERHRKSHKKRQPEKVEGSDADTGTSEQDFLVKDEVYKFKLATIKREEENILKDRDRYELEKCRLIREMKRIRDENGSRFNNYQILNHRYALLNLLGRGGFSEVYKAFDLVDHRYVACKLHSLNTQWSEEKKQSYMRHAKREYNIHKTLVHPHIVQLWDIFEIDNDTFCTVLEYCSGKDLDAFLKVTPILPEKEAKIIIVQIFRGLVYLNKRPQKIIHYDLKPGNILFDEVGFAKMTDFGLSKIVEDDVGSQGMELTSQGAGTYWYLPPECFDVSKVPKISSKVDVWSMGVMLYQLLFGKRPFGHDQTQERILREDTIINARMVEFPSKPFVTDKAKDLICKCLTYDKDLRPDVLAIAQHPFFLFKVSPAKN